MSVPAMKDLVEIRRPTHIYFGPAESLNESKVSKVIGSPVKRKLKDPAYILWRMYEKGELVESAKKALEELDLKEEEIKERDMATFS